MTIAWQVFTPWTALAGGALIGLAAALLMSFNGRIAGISGILAGLLQPVRRDWQWRAAFVAGLLLAPLLLRWFARLPAVTVDADWLTLVVAGLLVGVGTRYGSGCTSGHGVCGLSRFSVRSLVATATFMGSGFLVVYLVRHLVLRMTGAA
ncbi:YeeE/YedE family protein [Undibacterium sp. Jales W-56]|uniref:YeeE/YedE family protein n=1 Tax=Undibacterium sp. Jales W-56 TaxID=2897325 RepID=UPI0021D3922B|nr:YeeE/YedE family protein [Undibacterium sp. Jales W-56]MCU6435677.1 YeeE/YedE family protein [Undibacterium sp. Jales W-56]